MILSGGGGEPWGENGEGRRARRSTAPENSPKQPSAEPQPAPGEREVYGAAILRGEQGSAGGRSCKPPKTALKPSFSIVWKNFHCAENYRPSEEATDLSQPPFN